MKIAWFFIVSFLMLSTSAVANDTVGDDKQDVYIYNIIFDIGVQDRDAYITIMKNLFAGNKPGAGVVIGTDKDGVTDYSANITIQDENGNILFDEFFTGYFRSDYSDVIKQQANRVPPITREQYREGLAK